MIDLILLNKSFIYNVGVKWHQCTHCVYKTKDTHDLRKGVDKN